MKGVMDPFGASEEKLGEKTWREKNDHCSILHAKQPGLLFR